MWSDRRPLVGVGLLILGAVLLAALFGRESAPEVTMPVARVGGGDPQHQSTKARAAARKHRADRPPILADYGPTTPCEDDLHFHAPPYNATSIRVSGEATCAHAAALVRRIHERCTYLPCNTAEVRCDAHDVATQVLAVYCRNLEYKAAWYFSAYG
jgi:hypothetical protein